LGLWLWFSRDFLVLFLKIFSLAVKVLKTTLLNEDDSQKEKGGKRMSSLLAF
jgi:hypothetical protein